MTLFYTEKGGLLEEEAQYYQRVLSSLSRQRIALETQTRVDPEFAEELLHSRQFPNTNSNPSRTPLCSSCNTVSLSNKQETWTGVEEL